MKKVGWEFSASEKGTWQGFNDSNIERFKKGRYLSLVREVIQNSRDAHDTDKKRPVKIVFNLEKRPVADIPDVKQLRKKIEACIPYARKESSRAEKWFERAHSLITSRSVDVLSMSDYNTTGMVGPCEKGTAYFAYMKAMGTSVKSEMSGGSHGIGKRAPLASSQLRTLFVSTCYKNRQRKAEYLAQGFSLLMSHMDGSKGRHKIFDGEGFWGYRDGCEPLSDFERLPDWMKRSEIGTSLYLLAFETSPNWKERLAAITLSNYFAAILRGQLEVKIQDMELTQANIGECFQRREVFSACLEDVEEREKFDAACYFFEALDDACPDLKTEDSELTTLGHTQVRLLIREGLPQQYAVIRGGMLITMTLPGLHRFPNHKDFSAVVECLNPQGEKFLRALEPSRHDAFEVDQLEDEDDRDKARTALKRLKEFIRASIKRHAHDSSTQAGSVDFMSQFLGDENTSGLESGEMEVNPDGKVLITAKPLKHRPAPVKMPDEGDAGGGPSGESNEGSEAAATGGPAPGEMTGSGGGAMGGETKYAARNLRVIESATGRHKISFSSEFTGKAKLSLNAVGMDAEERLVINSSDLGIVSDGAIILEIKAGQRVSVSVELNRSSKGAYRLVCEEVKI